MDTPQLTDQKGYFEKNKKMIALLAVLLLIFLGIMAYAYFIYHPALSNNAINGSVVSGPATETLTPQPAPVSTPVSNTSNPVLPNGWTMETNTICNVKFPTPVNVVPYIDGAKTWQTETMGSYLPFTEGARVILKTSDNNGSDASTPDVEVFCLPNATTSEGPGIVALLDTDAKSLGGSTTLVDTIQKWGIDNVYVVNLTAGQTNGETGYVFTKGTTGYYVRVLKYSYDSPFNTYAQTIFDNLQFN